MCRKARLFFWIAFALANVSLVGLVALSATLPRWSLQFVASKFGYRPEATTGQLSYGRKLCASHYHTRLTSVNVTYIEARFGNDVGTSARISPVLEVQCAFGDSRRQDNSVHYMVLTRLTTPDEVPPN